MDHLEKAHELNLSLEDFLVVGGSVLDIYGIRKSSDFDVVVCGSAFEELKSREGWEVDHDFSKKWRRERIVNGIFEVSNDLIFEWGHGYTFTFEMLKSIAHKVDGVMVQPLVFLLLCKVHIGREKDLNDAQLIEEYFKQHKN